MPFDTDPDWPKPCRKRSPPTARRGAQRWTRSTPASPPTPTRRNWSISRSASGVVRVSGPFTVEGVTPEELNLGEEGLFDGDAERVRGRMQVPPVARCESPGVPRGWCSTLRADGLTFLDNKRRSSPALEPLFEDGTGQRLHAEGPWEDGDETARMTRGGRLRAAARAGHGAAGRGGHPRRDGATTSWSVAGFTFDAEAYDGHRGAMRTRSCGSTWPTSGPTSTRHGRPPQGDAEQPALHRLRPARDRGEGDQGRRVDRHAQGRGHLRPGARTPSARPVPRRSPRGSSTATTTAGASASRRRSSPTRTRGRRSPRRWGAASTRRLSSAFRAPSRCRSRPASTSASRSR